MTDAIIKGLGLGIILALSVGPVIFTILKQSLTNGHRGGFSFVTGVWISDIILVVLSNFFSELVHDLLSFKAEIAIAGGIFLGGMGIFYIFFKKVNLQVTEPALVPSFTKNDFSKIAFSGFLINTLNPSVIIFWLMNATAFSALYSFGERMLIFTICILVNVAADVLKVMMAGKIRNSLTPRHIDIINKVAGIILVIFGIMLIYGSDSLQHT
ncbi:MAG: LysE family translocator [Sphingobacteriales bacterium]